jgi:four helix bundle protein
MAKIERFEDLIAWQKARDMRRAIKSATASFRFRTDLDLRSQIRRAALSVMSNIAEGFERGSRAEFAHFLATSKASCGEVRSLLYAAYDDDLLDQPTFDRLYAQTDEVSRVVGGLRATVVKQRDADRRR